MDRRRSCLKTLPTGQEPVSALEQEPVPAPVWAREQERARADSRPAPAPPPTPDPDAPDAHRPDDQEPGEAVPFLLGSRLFPRCPCVV